MSEDAAQAFLCYAVYMMAAVVLLFVGYLAWRKVQRRRHRHRQIRLRSREHHHTWR